MKRKKKDRQFRPLSKVSIIGKKKRKKCQKKTVTVSHGQKKGERYVAPKATAQKGVPQQGEGRKTGHFPKGGEPEVFEKRTKPTSKGKRGYGRKEERLENRRWKLTQKGKEKKIYIGGITLEKKRVTRSKKGRRRKNNQVELWEKNKDKKIIAQGRTFREKRFSKRRVHPRRKALN